MGPVRRPCRLALLAALLAAGPALGQQARPPVLPPPLDPQRTVPEKVDPPLPGKDDDTTGTLSDRLHDSRGVIRPPTGIAPDMRVPAPVPHPGTTPVIPPPGTPGGADAPTPR